MTFDAIPLWGMLFITVVLVMGAMELGYRLGAVAHRRSAGEKESAVSVISGSILGLSAFMLAFLFSIVAERYDTKKALVREDANAIRVAWVRTDFLPEADRAEATALLHRYLDARLEFVQARDLRPERVRSAFAETKRIQDRLWGMAVANVRLGRNSDIDALYVEALNEMSRIHALRVSIGLQARIPLEIWLVTFGITFLGMMVMGYQTAIADSKRSKAQPLLALAFAVVFVLVVSLDRPDGGLVRVTQQPLIDLRETMQEQR